MAESSIWKKLNDNKYLHAAAFLLICWGAVFRFQGTNDQRMYWIGQAVGYGIAVLIVMGLVALAFTKLRPFAVLAAIYVAAISAPVVAFAQSGAATAMAGSNNSYGQSYVSNKFMADWMSKSRVICADRDVATNTCHGVMQVVSVGPSIIDVVAFVYTQGIKVMMPMRYQIEQAGLCYPVQSPSDFNATVYASATAVGEISQGDQPIVLTPDQRAEIWRVGMGASGWRVGDKICSRYSVHDRNGDTILALAEHVWKNGALSPDDSGSTLHFYGEGTRLPLKDMATLQ